MERACRWRVGRKILTLAAGAVVLQTFFQTNGCAEYATSFALGAVNFCSVLNCTGTSLFNFCDPQILLIDCVAPV